jgi:hypothetical protein
MCPYHYFLKKAGRRSKKMLTLRLLNKKIIIKHPVLSVIFNISQLMGLREVKSELNKLDKEDLIKHISELHKKYKPIKEYFDFYINPNENRVGELRPGIPWRR